MVRGKTETLHACTDSIEDRNLTSHNYDDETAEEIYEAVVAVYYPLFLDFERMMLPLSGLEPSLS